MFYQTLRAIALVALVAILGGCDADTKRKLAAAFSDAKPQISNLSAHDDVKTVNGEADYGYTVTFTMKNIGQAGVIKVQPWLSCSEGEYCREQNLYFDANETKMLTYFFAEPTINATNVQYGVRR